jgi:hypothetical protein
MLPHTPPSSARRATASMLILWPIWLVLFVIIMSAIGTTSANLTVGGLRVARNSGALSVTAGLMLSAFVLIMILFLVFADFMFLSTHTYVNSIFDLRRLRGINLGVNIASMFIFPLIAVIGVPLTIAGISRHRTKSPRLYGWSAACGSASLIFLIVATLVLAITSSVGPTNTSPEKIFCTTQWTDTTSFTTIQFFDNVTTTSLNTTTIGNLTTDPTTAACVDVSISMYTYTYTKPLLFYTVSAPVAAAVLGLLWFFTHVAFLVMSDKMILKLLPLPETSSTPGQIQLASAPSDTLVHACPNCSTPVQFKRTGPTTTVQCFSCSATVEFATD